LGHQASRGLVSTTALSFKLKPWEEDRRVRKVRTWGLV
jgi:hypothetical protein